MRRPSTPSSGSLACAPMFPTREHRWFDTTVITAMSAGAKGKNKTMMNGYPVSWNRIRTQRNIERTGPDLPASGGLIQKIGACPGHDSGRLTPLTCPNCSGKMKIISLMWTPYLPVRDRTQTGTRRTSCHEPRNRNRVLITSPYHLTHHHLTITHGCIWRCLSLAAGRLLRGERG